MKKQSRLAAGLAAVIISLGTAPSLAQSAQPHGSHARLTLAAARRIALAARPGAVAAQELEKEAGGSGLRYSFDIRAGAKTYEVGVDANSGKVIENSVEGSKPD